MSNQWDKLISHPDHSVSVGGIDIEVHDGVFTPDSIITYSTSILLDNLPDMSGKTVLDLGCGTGVVSVHCALNGARSVVAADVSKGALKNVTENISNHGVDDLVEILESDLFENVDGTFDHIFANLPILDEVWSTDDSTMNVIKRFITNYQRYLKKGGSAYLVWGSFADIKPVLYLLNHRKVSFTEVSVQKLGYTWTLLKLAP